MKQIKYLHHHSNGKYLLLHISSLLIHVELKSLCVLKFLFLFFRYYHIKLSNPSACRFCLLPLTLHYDLVSRETRVITGKEGFSTC